MRLKKELAAGQFAVALALVLLLFSGTVSGQSIQKFYRDDPMLVEPETQDA